MDSFLTNVVSLIQHYITTEWLSIIELSFLCFALLFFFRFFQKIGVFIFIALAVLIGNIQILHEAHFSFIDLPLGTLAFSTSFLASNLLNEHFGKKEAQKAVFLTFFIQIFFGLMMILTLGYKPLPSSRSYYQSMLLLFTPSLRLFIASLSAFVIAQLVDIFIFDYLKRGRSLFERSNIAILFSALIDNTVFSLLTFYFLAPHPYPLKKIFFEFILGTYWIRVFVGFLETPIIYLSYKLKSRPTI